MDGLVLLFIIGVAAWHYEKHQELKKRLQNNSGSVESETNVEHQTH